MAEEPHASSADVEVKRSDDKVDGTVDGDEREILINSDSHSQRKEGNKEEYEDTSLDGEFIKVEKESEDVKESTHSQKPMEVEETPSATDVDSSNSAASINLLEAKDKIKSLELQLESVAKELQHSESEIALLKNDVDLANDKIETMNRHSEELELDQKRMKEENLSAEQKYNLQLASFQEEKETLQSMVDDLNTNLSLTKELCSQLEIKSNQADQNFGKTESLLSQALSEKKELEEEIKSLERLHYESKEVAEASSRRNLELEGLIQSSNEAEERAKAHLRETEVRLISAEKQTANLEQQVSLADKKFLEAGREIKERNEKITELTTMLGELEEEHALSRCYFQAHEDKIRQLESSLSSSSSKNLELQQELKDLAEKCAEHEGRATATHQRSVELEDLVHISHSKAEDAGKKMEELEQLLEASRNRTQDLEQLLSITEAKCRDADAESKQHSSRVSELLIEVEEYQTKTKSIEVVLQTSIEKERELRDMLHVITEEKNKIEEFSKNSSDKLLQAENLIEILQSDLKSAQEKLESVEKGLEASVLRESEIFEKLKSAEEHLEHQGKVVEHTTARHLELESLHESLVKDSQVRLQEALVSFTQKDSEAKQLHEKLKSFEEQAGFYKNQAVEATEEVALLKAELNENAVKLVDAENSAEELKRKISANEAKAEQTLSEKELLAGINSQLKSELESNQLKINELHELLSSIQVEKDATAEQVASHVKTIAEISNQHSRGLELHSATESRMKETEVQLCEALEKFAQRDSEARNLNEKLHTLEEQQKLYEEQLSEMAALSETQKVELDEALLKIQNLERFVHEIKSKADQLETENEDLATVNVIQSQQRATHESKINELETALKAAIAEKEDALSQLHSLRKTIEDLMQQISCSMDDNNMLNRMYQEAKEELQTIKVQMEEQVIGHKEREISLTANLDNLKTVETEKSLLQAQISELEHKLFVAETRYTQEIQNMGLAATEKEAELSSKLVEHAEILREKDILNQQLQEVQKDLNHANSTIEEQVMEEGRKLELFNVELNNLKHQLSQSVEQEKKISELEGKLRLAEARSREQGKDGTLETDMKDASEVRSRDLGLGASSPSKRKSKKRSDGLHQNTDNASASPSAVATTVEPSGMMTFKLILGVALISVIMGIILGKKY